MLFDAWGLAQGQELPFHEADGVPYPTRSQVLPQLNDVCLVRDGEPVRCIAHGKHLSQARYQAAHAPAGEGSMTHRDEEVVQLVTRHALGVHGERQRDLGQARG